MMVVVKKKWPQAQAQIPLQERVLASVFSEDDVYEVVKQRAWR